MTRDRGFDSLATRVGSGVALATALAAMGLAVAQSGGAPEPLLPAIFTRVIELAGSYSGWFEGEPCSLRIRRDGEISMVIGSRLDESITCSGNAELDAGRLTLRWSERVLPRTFSGCLVGADGELERPSDRPWGTDAWRDACGRWMTIRTQLEAATEPDAEAWLVVPWQAWTVLVRASDGEAFCRAVNAGDEPAERSAPLTEWLTFRRGNVRLPSGLPEVPAEWSAWLLPAPVEGRLASEERDGTWWVQLIDATGIEPGMVLNTQGKAARWKPVPHGTPGSFHCSFDTDLVDAFGPRDQEAAPEQWTGTVLGRVEEVAGRNVRVRWNRSSVVLQAGAIVSSLVRANGATLGVDLVDPEEPRLDLTQAPMLPGTEGNRFKWQALILRAFLDTDDTGSDADATARRRAAREALDAIDPVELLPACQRALSGQDFTNERHMRAVSALLTWWDGRQLHVYVLGFDTDALRQTPLATVQRLAAVARWAAWWEQTAADPRALARYRAAVQAAGSG